MSNYKPYFDLGSLIAKYMRNELTAPEKRNWSNGFNLTNATRNYSKS